MKKYLLTLLFITTLVGFIAYNSFDNNTIIASEMFLGDYQHTGEIKTKGLNSFKQIKWSLKTDAPVFGVPIIYNNVLLIGNDEDYLYALNKDSGEIIWKFLSNGDIRSAPCVINEAIFLSSEDGNLYKLDKGTGKEIWHFSSKKKLENRATNYFNIASSPMAEGKTVFYGSGDGNMYALDTETGKLLWKFQTNASIASTPALYSERIYFGSLDGNMYCLDSKSGSMKWKYTLRTHSQSPESPVMASPLIMNDTVYFGGMNFYMYALDMKTGLEKWSRYMGDQPIFSSSAYKNNTIYFGTAGWHFPRIYAIDTNGEDKWIYQRKDRSNFNSNGDLYVVNWDQQNHYYVASPIISENLLYIGSWDNNLYALDINTGQLRWKFETKGPLGAPVSVRDGTVYLGSSDGYVYALSE